jgi:hypothetical protein
MSRLFQLNRIVRGLINGQSPGGGFWKSPLAISAGIHGGGVCLLAIISFSLAHSPAPDLEAVWQSDPVPEVIAPALTSESMSTTPDAGGSTGNTGRAGSMTLPVVVSEPAVGAPEIGFNVPLDSDSMIPRGRALGQSVWGRAGQFGGQGRGIGNGIGDGVGSGTGPGFFGAPSRGTKFVYALDCSGSMAEPHSESRSRFERLKIELVNSIGTLAPDMEFFVVFFNQNSVPMPAKKLQPATAENKRKYLEWVVRVRGGGGTDPRDALKLAFELEPDVIYLLTDGYFDDKVPEAITRLNTRQAAIHTFCLGDRSGEEMLRAIAERNGGTYKFVP